MSTVAQAVRTARRTAGFTQKTLAEALGIESITVSRWERGVTTPSLARLHRIAELTQTPIGDLVRETGEPGLVVSELTKLREEVAAMRESLERFIEAVRRRQAA